MSRITSVRRLFDLMSAGHRLVQDYLPAHPGGPPRDVFYLDTGERRIGIPDRILTRAIHSHRLTAAEVQNNGFGPRIWQLKPKKRTSHGR